ncbi:MAG TPA: tannase/feruloyl esterase family alpha/beta hydrolase [Steroidobacteraceae bacterium]|nr:tannase/feruloyl esterase family alpha/beta hydrolase [Steroidobacteraceae bacterium]
MSSRAPRPGVLAASCVLILGLLQGRTALAQGAERSGSSDSPRSPAQCSTLAGRSIGGAQITRAQTGASPFSPQAATPGGSDAAPAGKSPASGATVCIVVGRLHRALDFRLVLPTTWDGRLLYYGGGGWDGILQTTRFSPQEVLASTAVVSSNGGHTANPIDARWALHDAQARLDFASLSVHSVLEAARDIVREYYGAEARHRYFEGCSNGGREALIEATRFPADFEGIIARAPAHAWTPLFSAFVRNAQRQYGTPGGALTAQAARLVEQEALAQCDRLDGLQDGIISRPQACRVSFDRLQCKGTRAGEQCLTPEQLQTVQVLFSEVRGADGRVEYPGWGPGGEQEGWSEWIIGAAVPGAAPPSGPGPGAAPPMRGAQFLFAEGFVRYWLTEDPTADVLHFDPAHHAAAIDLAGTLLNVQPDLAAFVGLGHKLILWHGTADWAISYKSSVDLFERIGRALGESRRDAAMEFYLAPGVGHCAGGAGADQVDLLTPLTRWVEQGERPSSAVLTAGKRATTGRVLMSRPLCRYPAYPRYEGGDPSSAASFSCARR